MIYKKHGFLTLQPEKLKNATGLLYIGKIFRR
jgi:hypothetical protein